MVSSSLDCPLPFRLSPTYFQGPSPTLALDWLPFPCLHLPSLLLHHPTLHGPQHGPLQLPPTAPLIPIVLCSPEPGTSEVGSEPALPAGSKAGGWGSLVGGGGQEALCTWEGQSKLLIKCRRTTCLPLLVLPDTSYLPDQTVSFPGSPALSSYLFLYPQNLWGLASAWGLSSCLSSSHLHLAHTNPPMPFLGPPQPQAGPFLHSFLSSFSDLLSREWGFLTSFSRSFQICPGVQSPVRLSHHPLLSDPPQNGPWRCTHSRLWTRAPRWHWVTPQLQDPAIYDSRPSAPTHRGTGRRFLPCQPRQMRACHPCGPLACLSPTGPLSAHTVPLLISLMVGALSLIC